MQCLSENNFNFRINDFSDKIKRRQQQLVARKVPLLQILAHSIFLFLEAIQRHF